MLLFQRGSETVLDGVVVEEERMRVVDDGVRVRVHKGWSIS